MSKICLGLLLLIGLASAADTPADSPDLPARERTTPVEFELTGLAVFGGIAVVLQMFGGQNGGRRDMPAYRERPVRPARRAPAASAVSKRASAPAMPDRRRAAIVRSTVQGQRRPSSPIAPPGYGGVGVQEAE